MDTTQQAKEFFTGLQERIVERLEKVDGKRFHRDKWERPEGGGGLS
jgi:coproporphyrinogen III oxidase